MRGILFCVSFLALCFGILSMGDAAIAAPLHSAPAQALWGWAWFALSLGFLVVAPERQVPEPAVAAMEVEEDHEAVRGGIVLSTDWYDGEDYLFGQWEEEMGQVGYDGIEVETEAARPLHVVLPLITPEMRLQWQRISALRAGLEMATSYYEVFAIRRELAAAIRA